MARAGRYRCPAGGYTKALGREMRQTTLGEVWRDAQAYHRRNWLCGGSLGKMLAGKKPGLPQPISIYPTIE